MYCVVCYTVIKMILNDLSETNLDYKMIVAFRHS